MYADWEFKYPKPFNMKSTEVPENDIGKQRGKDMNWNLSSNESKTAQE